jgi:hypothetical protein
MQVGGYHLWPQGGGVQRGRGRGVTETGVASYTGKLIFQTVATGTPIASTNALTAFDQFATIAKGLLNVVGARMVFEMWGHFSSTGTPSLQVLAKFDDPVAGDELGNNAVAAVGNNAVAWGWRYRAGCVVRTTGVSGTVQPFPATLVLANNTTGIGITNQVIAATITQNTNTAHVVYGAVQWGTPSASNTIQVDGMSVEIDYAFATA